MATDDIRYKLCLSTFYVKKKRALINMTHVYGV